MLATVAAGDDDDAIRDHAILSLLIHYGLRRGEVERLTLDDLDWKAEVIHIMRQKLRKPQVYLIAPLFSGLASPHPFHMPQKELLLR